MQNTEKLSKNQVQKMIYTSLQNNFVVGIDVGHSTVTAAIGQLATDGRVRILSVGTSGKAHTGLEKNELTNPKNASMAIGIALDALRERIENVEIDEFSSVVVNVSGKIESKHYQHSKIVSAANKEVTAHDLHTMQEDMYGSYENNFLQAGEKPLHVVAQNYIIDEKNTKQPIGTIGAMIKTNFLLVISSQKDIDRITRAIEYCELKIDEYTATPIASAKAVLTAEEKEDGVALIDIGAKTTSLSIYTEGKLRYTTIIPFGGDSITKDIRDGLNISMNTAENIKIKGGEAMHSKDTDDLILSYEGSRGTPHQEISAYIVAGIIESKLSEMLEDLCGEIQQSGYAHKLYEGIVLTGGTALTRKIQPLCEFIMHKKTRIGTPNQNLSNGDEKRYRNPAYAAAIGLVINEFDRMTEKQEIDIYATAPKNEKPKKEKASGGGWLDKIRNITTKGKDMLLNDDMGKDID